jgi:hypothetical protein
MLPFLLSAVLRFSSPGCLVGLLKLTDGVTLLHTAKQLNHTFVTAFKRLNLDCLKMPRSERHYVRDSSYSDGDGAAMHSDDDIPSEASSLPASKLNYAAQKYVPPTKPKKW